MARTNDCQRLLDWQHADLRDQIRWGLVAVVCCIRLAVGQPRSDCDCRAARTANGFDESQRFVFQGVRTLFDGQSDQPWGDALRRNQRVFIGCNLDEQSRRRGFEACLI